MNIYIYIYINENQEIFIHTYIYIYLNKKTLIKDRMTPQGNFFQKIQWDGDGRIDK